MARMDGWVGALDVMSSFALTHTGCFPACHHHSREVLKYLLLPPLPYPPNPPDPFRSGSIAAAPTHPVAGEGVEGVDGNSPAWRLATSPPIMPDNCQPPICPRGNSMLFVLRTQSCEDPAPSR